MEDFNYQNKEDNVDLKKILPFYLRNKKWLFIINSFIFAYSLLYGITRKDIWQGEFQIVLKLENSNKGTNIGSTTAVNTLNRFFNINPAGSSISTEVEILKSSSVLNPVFEKVKGKDSKDLTLSSWVASSFDIDVVDGTTVLNLAYRDTEKSQIIPVLNQISKIYQDYSGRNRSKSIQSGINYVEKQIEIYKANVSKVLEDTQSFANKHDLLRQIPKDFIKRDDVFLNPLPIEIERSGIITQKRLINQQILELKKLEIDNDAFLFFTQQRIPKLTESGLPSILAQKDQSIAFAKSKFKNQDRSILALEEEKKILMDMLKQRAYSYLNARKSNLEALEKSLYRPDEVIIKFKEMTRDLKRVNKTLIELENEYQLLQLEKAQNSEPWELITKSTLLPNPVGPSRINIYFIGFVLGHLIAVMLLMLKERKDQIIYSSEEISKIMNFPIMLNIDSNYNKDSINSSFELLVKNRLNNDEKNKSGLFAIGNFEIDQLNIVKNLIMKFSDNKNVKIVNSIIEMDDYENKILILKTGNVTMSQLKIFKETFKLINNNSNVGIIILNKDI